MKNNLKFKKLQKIRVPKDSYDYKRNKLLYGFYGLKAIESVRLQDKQLEAAKKILKKVIKKIGIIWVLVKANLDVTKKPQQVRMGKGKGAYHYSVAVVKKGTILFEIGGGKVPKKLAWLALALAAKKLPIKTQICNYRV